MDKIRAKFIIHEVKPVTPDEAVIQITAYPVTPSKEHPVPEDQRFHRYTPCGKLEMTIDNPPVAEFMKRQVGKGFYVDLIPVGQGQ